MKKVLSIVLSIAMVLCMMPAMAFAGTASVAKANAFFTAVLIEDLKATFLCLLASAIRTLFFADLMFAILYFLSLVISASA